MLKDTASLLSELGHVRRARRPDGGPAHGTTGRVSARRHRPAHRVVVIPETRALSPMPYADHLSRPNVS
jgi:hypothetical protein